MNSGNSVDAVFHGDRHSDLELKLDIGFKGNGQPRLLALEAREELPCLW